MYIVRRLANAALLLVLGFFSLNCPAQTLPPSTIRSSAPPAEEAFTISFRRTDLDTEAEGTAEVYIGKGELTVRIQARNLPLPSQWREANYSVWVDISNYGYKLHLGDLPLSVSESGEGVDVVESRIGDELSSVRAAKVIRGSSDTIFRLNRLPRGATFGGLIVTAEPARYGNIINEPLRPLLVARAVAGDIYAGPLNDRAIQNPPPDYPEMARQRRVFGRVRVFVEIDDKGGVVAVSKASGSPMLTGSASSAVRNWKFQPVTITGAAVPVKGFVEIYFSPPEDSLTTARVRRPQRPTETTTQAKNETPSLDTGAKSNGPINTNPPVANPEVKPPASDSTALNAPKPVAPPDAIPATNRAPVSGGVLIGNAISLPKPVYPAAARAAGINGRVVVEVAVDEKGNVTSAQALSGPQMLKMSALAAARRARFEPTLLSGQPVKASKVISYDFSKQIRKTDPKPEVTESTTQVVSNKTKPAVINNATQAVNTSTTQPANDNAVGVVGGSATPAVSDITTTQALQPAALPDAMPAPNRAPVSGGVSIGNAISLPKPLYPAAARAAGINGRVVVEVAVDEKGNVTSAQALSGPQMLKMSALAAARLARFEPTLLSGQPVKATKVITYDFAKQLRKNESKPEVNESTTQVVRNKTKPTAAETFTPVARDSAKQPATDNPAQVASEKSTTPAIENATEASSDKSKQPAIDNANQVATESAKPPASDIAAQPAGDNPKSRSDAAPAGDVVIGRALSLPKPMYPAAARATGKAGIIVVEVTIDEKGNVTSVRALSGPPMLTASAMAAARLARFEPTVRLGQPVKVTKLITYDFKP